MLIHYNTRQPDPCCRLSVSTTVSAGGARAAAEPKQKMPQNREIDLIDKWKDVDLSDLELNKTRNLYEKKMQVGISAAHKLKSQLKNFVI